MSREPVARRLAMALDASGVAWTWFALAVDLAARSGAELRAQFVEDLDLLRAVGLPFAREIDLLTAAAAEVDVATIEARWRRLAAAARARLAIEADRRRVAWTFAVVRGRWPEAIAARVAESDVLVLADQPAPAAVGRVVAIVSEFADHAAALARARELAGAAGFDVVVCAESPARAHRLEQELRADAGSPPSDVLRVAPLDVAGLRALRRSRAFGLAVLAGGDALPAALAPDVLARALGCPVLVLTV